MRGAEIDMLDLHSAPVADAQSITSTKVLQDVQSRMPSIHVSDEIRAYIIDLARTSREHRDIALGASPRAALCLMHAARARAILAGRSYVTHEDVQAMLQCVLAHRLILRPEAEVEGRHVSEVINEFAMQVPVTGGHDIRH